MKVRVMTPIETFNALLVGLVDAALDAGVHPIEIEGAFDIERKWTRAAIAEADKAQAVAP